MLIVNIIAQNTILFLRLIIVIRFEHDIFITEHTCLNSHNKQKKINCCLNKILKNIKK